jgi:signal transduction histidine kinase
VTNAIGSEKQVKIDFEAPEDPVMISIDPGQIEDAVLNLIINAIEAVDVDGQVTIRLSTPQDDAEEIAIEVSDNGTGISEPDLSKVFDPFFTTRQSGTGLGLPSVRRIARLHGGGVDVKSSPGQGSVFTIRLPLIRSI